MKTKTPLCDLGGSVVKNPVSRIDTRREELFGEGKANVTWDSVFFFGMVAGLAVATITFCLIGFFTRPL